MSPRRTRRTFSNEFKARAVELVLKGGRDARDVARELEIDRSVLQSWVRLADPKAPPAPAESEKDELQRLRREVETLRMEREFLKKAAAFFAKETK
jgi:transposase